jgi:hypothetical protein
LEFNHALASSHDATAGSKRLKISDESFLMITDCLQIIRVLIRYPSLLPRLPLSINVKTVSQQRAIEQRNQGAL